MLRQIADGVWVHKSTFMQSNAVIVRGEAGVLLVDAGVRGDELACLASDLHLLRQPVVAGFSTHPHWDHLLWHSHLGTPPRYGTAQCASSLEAHLSDPKWRTSIAGMIPTDIIDQVPLDALFGRITGLPAGTARIAWDGPQIRILEHQAHAPGHAALLIEEPRVLVAGDMLSDILIPMLNLFATNPLADYLAALDLIEGIADDITVVVPGHGSVSRGDELFARIARDRRYLNSTHEGRAPNDRRLGPDSAFGTEMTGVHDRQVHRLTAPHLNQGHDTNPG